MAMGTVVQHDNAVSESTQMFVLHLGTQLSECLTGTLCAVVVSCDLKLRRRDPSVSL